MAIRGTLSVPKGVITGAFNIRVALARPVEDFSIENIVVETLTGDALGHTKDRLGGSGANYHLLCYIPDARSGKSRISVDGFDVPPVVVEYDTVKVVSVTWGTPFRRGSKTEIPLTLDVPALNLNKRNFKVSPRMRFQLYGADAAYSLVFPRTPALVEVLGTVHKQNGIVAALTGTGLEVERGTPG